MVKKKFLLVTEGQVTSIPSDKTINFTIPLIGESFTLGIQLLEEQKICSYKNIMYGTIADGDNSSAEEDGENIIILFILPLACDAVAVIIRSAEQR